MPDMKAVGVSMAQPFTHFCDGKVAYGFSTRAMGNMSLTCGDPGCAVASRMRFLEGLGMPFENLVCARQVHGDTVAYAALDDRGRGAQSADTAFEATDALITDKKNLPLAVFTADCLPVFLYDPVTVTIAIVHAGWRSTQKQILRKTIISMQHVFGTRPRSLVAGFGPAIRDCCYTVGDDMRSVYPEALIEREGKLYLDLVSANIKQLVSAGVAAENIDDSQLCTSCNKEHFFSYRREGDTSSRLMSVIMLQ